MISLLDLAKRDKWICHVCTGRVLKLSHATRDHIMPKAYGGTNARENLALAHKWCNKAKGSKIFRAEQNGTGWVIVDPNNEIVSDEYPTYIDAYTVAQDMNADRLYMDTHYETARELSEGDMSDIIIIKRAVQDNSV